MKTMTVTEFKAHALEEIKNVAETKEPLTLTKHGRPVAEVIPFRNTKGPSIPGSLAGMLEYEEDIVSPLGSDMWKSAR